MRRLAMLAAVALAAAGTTARAEQLTVALSTPEVTISSNFTGTTVTLFGVINLAGAVSRVGPYHVAVLLIGPPQTVIARRKDRFLGVWANAAAETFQSAPAYYSLSTSAPIESLASPESLERLQLGFDHIALKQEPVARSSTASGFRDAFIRLKGSDELYAQRVGVDFIGDLVFRTTFRLPANVPVGKYTAEAYLFSDGSLVARGDDKLTVSKSGLEDRMSTFAHSQALLYGLICVALALVTGWLGGVIFRRD